jgi:hypothetical protein
MRQRRPATGNLVNPMVGCGMQQARGRMRGVSRQGGEKPRRRNMSDGWHRRAKAGCLHLVGVNAHEDVDGGAVFEEPWRRKSGTAPGRMARCVSPKWSERCRSGAVMLSGRSAQSDLRGDAPVMTRGETSQRPQQRPEELGRIRWKTFAPCENDPQASGATTGGLLTRKRRH